MIGFSSSSGVGSEEVRIVLQSSSPTIIMLRCYPLQFLQPCDIVPSVLALLDA